MSTSAQRQAAYDIDGGGDGGGPVERYLWPLTWLYLGLSVVSLAALYLDERMLGGVNVWLKPFKFDVSLAIYYATLIWLIPLTQRDVRQSRWFQLVVCSSIVAGFLEIFWITFQAARGRASHFNFSPGFESIMYSVMGVGAVCLVVVTAIVGLMILRRGNATVSVTYRSAAGWGLIAGSVLTLIVAGYLGGNGHHLVDVSKSGAGSLPLVGWSTVTGDLRVPHFFATHAMQLIPLLGWFAAARGIAWVRLGVVSSAVYSLLVLGLFGFTLAGYSLF